MVKLKYYLSILLLVLFVAACSSDDDNPTDPSNGEGNDITNNSGQPLPQLGQEDITGVMATISYEFATVPGFPAAAITMGFAQFGSGIDAGTVSVNNNTIEKTTQNGTTFYVVPNPSNPTAGLSGVNFDGSAHNWSVSGSGDVPEISGSVNSPRAFNLTAPASNAAITKSNGMDIAWSNTNDASNLLIVIADISNANSYVFIEGVADDGNYTVSADDLNGISGDALVQVVKYNYSIATAAGSNYAVIAEIVKSVTVTVN